jgi:hypothetical protein
MRENIGKLGGEYLVEPRKVFVPKKQLDISIANENLPNINEHLRPETSRLGLLGTVFNEHDTLITKEFALGKTPMQPKQPKACLEEGGGTTTSNGNNNVSPLL